MRPSSPPPTAGQAAPAAADDLASPAVATAAPRRYDTRVGRPTPPSPPHPWSSRRAPPSKRARTSGPGEFSSSRPQGPHSSPIQGPVAGSSQDLSLGSLIRRLILHCGPNPGNSDCSAKDLHNETFMTYLFLPPFPSSETPCGLCTDTP